MHKCCPSMHFWRKRMKRKLKMREEERGYTERPELGVEEMHSGTICKDLSNCKNWRLSQRGENVVSSSPKFSKGVGHRIELPFYVELAWKSISYFCPILSEFLVLWVNGYQFPTLISLFMCSTPKKKKKKWMRICVMIITYL